MSPIRQQAPVLGSAFVLPPQVTRVLGRAIIGAAALLLVLAAAAHAGRYHDYACRTPSGQTAPVDGWSGATTGVTFSYVENTCEKGGALVAALGDEPAERQANTDAATWTLTLPSPETLAGATLWRAGDTEGGTKINATYAFFFSGPTTKSVFDECLNEFYCPSRGTTTQPLSSENRVVVPAANLGTHLYMTATCTGAAEYKCQTAVGDAQGYSAVAYLYAADLVVEQTEGPTATNVSGPLTTDQPVNGTSDLIFSATDPGAGIYQALFNVDGNVVQSVPIDENGGHCRDVGQTTDGLPAFVYLQPCLKSVTADVGFDSPKVSNGVHHLIVSVSDPAGNTATVLDRSIIVQNEQGACNAECDGHASLHAADTRLLRRTLVRRFRNSGFSLTGQLVDHAGSPMNGAGIELRQQASYPGARNLLVATTTTNAKGEWKLRVPRGPSRVVTVGYRSRSNNPNFATQLQYRETVAAGVRLSAPRGARPGRPFAFRGKLAGGYIPRGGALVSLEIFFGGEWREIKLLRTNRHGAFAYRYTFAPIGPATYRFRAQLPHTIGYPFSSGASRSSYIHLAG
jgi:hypothetical protein